MSSFASVWNAVLPAGVVPDVLGAITEDAINNYLIAHWKYDNEKYSLSKELLGAGKAKFAVTVTVDRALRIELPQLRKAPKGWTKVFKYPSPPYGEHPFGRGNICLYADNNTFKFSWTTANGKSFSHIVKNVRFLIEAEVGLVTDGAQHNLRFSVTSLLVDQGQLGALLKIKPVDDPSCEEKIDALFLSSLQVMAEQAASKINETIEIPALNAGSIALYPSILAIRKKTIAIAAAGDISAMVRRSHAQLQANILRIREAFSHDVEQIGGLEALVFPSKVLRKASKLQSSVAQRLLASSATRSKKEIWGDLPKTRSVLSELSQAGASPSHGAQRAPSRRSMQGSAPGLGVAISERLLQALATQAMNIVQDSCTDEYSLVLVKGRVCANVHVWDPVISIGSAGLTATVKIDAWAGLQYWLKKVWDCSWSWDGPHNIGLGLAGTPKVTLSTKKDSRGLVINAQPDLHNVHLQTGINDLVDKIVAALDAPFIAILQAILYLIAQLLSLVVVPVKMSVPGQATAIQLADFITSQYLLGSSAKAGRNPNPKNFLAVDCATLALHE
jgi:hypothetical protein